jgi:uncharacterized protein
MLPHSFVEEVGDISMENERKIYDCHVNVFRDYQYQKTYFMQLDRVRANSESIVAGSTNEQLLTAMERVDKAILFSPQYKDSVGIDGSDDETEAAVKYSNGKFVGFAYVDPKKPDCLEQLKYSVENRGFRGVKYGPIYSGVPMSDPRFAPILKYCEKNDIPMTLHMGTTFARNAPVELGRAIHIEPVAMKHRDLKIILAHLGHPWIGDCIAVTRKQPNVYTEVSALFYRPWQYYNNLMLCQEYGIIDKIFFGTDFPFAQVGESIDGLKNVNQFVEGTKLPRISDESIETILYSNPFEHWWHNR